MKIAIIESQTELLSGKKKKKREEKRKKKKRRKGERFELHRNLCCRGGDARAC